MMDMHSRNQYLKNLRAEYRGSSKKEKSKLLDEAEKRTGLHRKHLIRKLQADTCLEPKKRKPRPEVYGSGVKAALVTVWKIFDYPCGQRLKPLLRNEVARLRRLGELDITSEVAEKLKRISAATIDRKLKHQREVERVKRRSQPKRHPQLYHKITVKAGDWNVKLLGQEQIDLVEHCGASSRGMYVCSLSVVDIATGWWEGQGVLGKGQHGNFEALREIRARMPITWREIHPDNDTAFINDQLYRYTQAEGLDFTRSRPYQKNDNCFVEQKNSTHIRQIFGYLRYDTETELKLINDLYRNELRLYKNFFQPVMKLKEKVRVKGRIHRRYDEPKTPYARTMASKEVTKNVRRKLKKVYETLNPAELKREIDQKLYHLYSVYERKNGRESTKLKKKMKPSMVTIYMS